MTRSNLLGRRRMTRREALRLAAAGLVLTGCSKSEPALIETAGDGDSDRLTRQALQQLLDRRAKAQVEEDERGYLADLDSSNENLLRRERMVFDNLRQFAIDDLQYVLGRFNFDTAYQRDSGVYRLGPVVKVVKLTADAKPKGTLGPGESLEYQVARRNGAWVVTDVLPLSNKGGDHGPGDPLVGPNMPSGFAPWNLDALNVIKAGNVWLAADGSVGDLEQYADAGEREAARVEGIWGDRPAFAGHVLFFTRRKKAFHEWYEKEGQHRNAAGVAHGEIGIRGNGEPLLGQYAGARMVIHLPRSEEFSQGPAQVMRHELVHAVTKRAENFVDGGLQPVRWAVEGFARFIEVRGDPDNEGTERIAAAQGFSGSLPNSDTFYDDDSYANYALGYTMFALVDQIRNLDTAIEFYAQVIKYGELAGGFAETPAFDRICQEVLGMGSAELLQRWGAFVQGGG